MVRAGKFSLAVACLQFCALLLISPVVPAASPYDHSPTVGPARGSLVIVGGGTVVPEIKKRFVELAGGADANFVLIPTAMRDDINLEQARGVMVEKLRGNARHGFAYAGPQAGGFP